MIRRALAALALLLCCATTADAAMLLLRDRDRVTGNAEEDARNWKRGMVVEVYEDTDPRGFTIPPPAPFVWLKITNATKAQVVKYIAAHTDADGNLLLRRLYRVYWEDLPARIQTAFATDRYYEDTWQKLRSYVKNQVTGASE